MAEPTTTRRRRTTQKAELDAAARFVEELSWLLSAHAHLDFKMLKRLRPPSEQPEPPDLLQRFAPRNPNIVYLVGTLPALFMDESIFPSNEDIADFSASALQINIPRWQKKAKFELVGHIVCHAVKLDDMQVANLVRALTFIVDGETDARNILASRKEHGLSWNEAIQSLLRDR